ncbi:hypothetical protein CVN68_01440 [Sphingomonas psychrotolerans]|uniref:Uncharacterized protein n=1 Tax=Sphingomonas psychrotolerans TaxID=1327635 RepID=A0A2K8MNM5_9SPHN|nr:hypothetical protein CVN68_01440 [Sphingomonas psychrotolerans]
MALLASAAGTLALAACSGKDEAEAPTSNVGNMAPIEAENTAAPVANEAPPATVIDNATATTPAETVPSDLTSDEQTQDDADATGMTARVSRDEGGNEAQPAE